MTRPRARSRAARSCVAALLLLAGCVADAHEVAVEDLPQECGLRSPDPRAPAGVVPEALLPPRSELVDVRLPRIGGMTAVVNLAYPVSDAFDLYKKASRDAGFEVVSFDDEGFEAEIWLRNRRELGSIVLRGSTCERASGAIISIVAKKDVAG